MVTMKLLRGLRSMARHILRSPVSKRIIMSSVFISQPLKTFSVLKDDSLGSQMKSSSICVIGEASKLMDMYQTALESLILEYSETVKSLCFIYESENVLQEQESESLVLNSRMSELKNEILAMEHLQEYILQSLENATRTSFLLGNTSVAEQSWEKINSFNKKYAALFEQFNSLALELTHAKVRHIEVVSNAMKENETKELRDS